MSPSEAPVCEAIHEEEGQLRIRGAKDGKLHVKSLLRIKCVEQLTLRVALDQPATFEHFAVEKAPGDWIVRDVLIDGASTLVGDGDYPADAVSTETFSALFQFRPCLREITFVVAYIGGEEDGKTFEATLHIGA